MRDVSRIPGAEQLLAIFGDWPSFQDAVVVWLHVDRLPSVEGCYGPTLEILLHHHVLIHFRFSEVSRLKLEGFNLQGPIWELSLKDIRDRQLERTKWAINFGSAAGEEVSFQCHNIEVVNVTPCDRNGNPTS